jgi:hypothetical protein
MENLDTLAAKAAQKIVNASARSPKELDILATKTLGVLQENGVYACVLFLFSRTREVEKLLADTIQKELFNLCLKLLPNGEKIPEEREKRLKFVTDKIASDLDTLLLVKQIWEQTLIYARYGAKANAEA